VIRSERQIRDRLLAPIHGASMPQVTATTLSCHANAGGPGPVDFPCVVSSSVQQGRITEIDVIADPARLRKLHLTVLHD
jgi:hypothetical protein